MDGGVMLTVGSRSSVASVSVLNVGVPRLVRMPVGTMGSTNRWK
jgi:hypothetical protein